ncbi:ATP-binding protein [Vreelandella utahensis]|uniref:ATP-binding protein n=1 Tax=Vreelandella halophila TaxID=86177 RepID=UPI000986A209|nr:ATP-binding protein [Halomonas utahensis]
MRPVRWTLYHRLLLLGMLPAVAMFVLMLLFFTQARLEDARQSLFRSTQLTADNLSPALEFPLIAGNQAELKGIITQTLERSAAHRIEVVNRDGEIVAAVSEQTPPDTPVHRFSSPVRQTAINLDGAATSTNPITSGRWENSNGRRLGEIRIAVSEAELAGEQEEILWTSAGIGLILFAATFLFSGRLAQRLSRPIERLADTVQKLPDEDPDFTRRDTRVARELQSLQQAVDAMAHRLRSAEAEREVSFRELGQARDKAEQANRAKSDFLAMMSHELRTPLHGVIGMLQLLEEEPLNSRQADYIVTARRSTEDLLVIINDLLDFSRIERGRLELEDAPFDLRSVIENCFASFRHDAESNQLTYQLELDGDWDKTPEVFGDPGRLRQVLAHLIGNAIKFTPEGEVTVSATWRLDSESEGTLICQVSDSGSGIPTERLGDMFSSFEQMDISASRGNGGTGLGLPLVQRLVELMGGHVAVDSEPGCGSRFRFVIPMKVHDHPPVQEEATVAPAVTPAIGARTREALVVEDNPVNQRVAARQLENLGFHVRCASSGTAAVDDVCENQNRYDVILMDCQMPGMDGWEATRRLRACERQAQGRRTPIIAMTADVLEDTEQSCLEAGMDAYLPKPVRRNGLRDTLRGLLPL